MREREIGRQSGIMGERERETEKEWENGRGAFQTELHVIDCMCMLGRESRIGSVKRGGERESCVLRVYLCVSEC